MCFLKRILRQLKGEIPIYIVSHDRPDGDAIGSSAALTYYLNQLGKPAFIVQTETIPNHFASFLIDVPVCTLNEIYEPAYWIALDCREPSRVASELQHKTYLLVIDHHPKENESVWGTFRCIRPQKSSTCEILTDLLSQNDYKFDNTYINEALYLGIMSDTGNFSHNNVTSSTFECAKHLVHAGVRPCKILQRLLKNKTQEQLKLQSLFLNRVKLYSNGAIAISILTEADYAQTHTSRNDTEGFVNQLLLLKDAIIAVFIEQNKTSIKGSMRSSDPSIAVNSVAQKWNGGGHICAAGFTCDPMQFSMKELVHDLDSLIC